VTVHTYIAGGVVELKRVEDNEVVGAGAPLDQAAGLSNPGRSLLFAAGAATIRSVVLLQLRQQMTSRRRVSVASSEPPHYGGWPKASCSSWAAVRCLHDEIETSLGPSAITVVYSFLGFTSRSYFLK
jgi:hypothetical protein